MWAFNSGRSARCKCVFIKKDSPDRWARITNGIGIRIVMYSRQASINHLIIDPYNVFICH